MHDDPPLIFGIKSQQLYNKIYKIINWLSPYITFIKNTINIYTLESEQWGATTTLFKWNLLDL